MFDPKEPKFQRDLYTPKVPHYGSGLHVMRAENFSKTRMWAILGTNPWDYDKRQRRVDGKCGDIKCLLLVMEFLKSDNFSIGVLEYDAFSMQELLKESDPASLLLHAGYSYSFVRENVVENRQFFPHGLHLAYAV